MERIACQVQAQGASPLIRQAVDLRAEAAPVAAEGGIPLYFGGAPAPPRSRARVVRSSRAADRSGSARRSDRTHGPSGDRPSSPSYTRPATDAKRRLTAPSSTARPRVSLPNVYTGTGIQKRANAEPLVIGQHGQRGLPQNQGQGNRLSGD